MYKISVIMPCYNVEKYIEDAFESLVHLSIFEEIEIIPVDDCSTDSTASIIEKYSKKYSNFKGMYNNTPSGGPGQPRNIALDNATGKYVTFLDSDDIVINDGYKVLFDTIEEYQSDLVIACRIMVLENNPISMVEQYDWIETPYYNATDINHKIKIIEGRPFYLHSIFKREIIENNSLRFIESISMSEDEIFCNQYLKAAHRITKINDIVYKYTMQREGSITTNIKLKEFDNFTKSMSYIKESLDIYPHIVYLQRCFDLTNYFAFQSFNLPSQSEQKQAYLLIAKFVSNFLALQIQKKELTQSYYDNIRKFVKVFSDYDYLNFLHFYEERFVSTKVDAEKRKYKKSISTKKLDVVIAFRNETHKTSKLIDSLIKGKSYNKINIIIIDCGTKENNQKFFQDNYLYKYDNISYHYNNPRSYSAAYNKASQIAESEYVAFFNENTKFADDTINEVLSFVEKNNDISLFEIVKGSSGFEKQTLNYEAIPKMDMSSLNSKVLKKEFLSTSFVNAHTNILTLGNFYLSNNDNHTFGIMYVSEYTKGLMNKIVMKRKNQLSTYTQIFENNYKKLLNQAYDLSIEEQRFFKVLILYDFIQLRETVTSRKEKRSLKATVDYHLLILKFIDIIDASTLNLIDSAKTKSILNLSKSKMISKLDIFVKRELSSENAEKINIDFDPIYDTRNKKLNIESENEVIFSIIITLNSQQHNIKETIDSLLNQTLDSSKIEIIIVDEGLNKDYEVIINEFIRKYSCIKYYKQETTKDQIISGAVGDYLCMIDSEYIYSNNVLIEVFHLFKKHSHDIDAVTIPLNVFDKATNSYVSDHIFEYGTRVVDLNVEPEVIINLLAVTFIKTTVFKKHYRNEKNYSNNNMQIVTEILEEKNKVALSCDTACFHKYTKTTPVNRTINNTLEYTQLFKEVYFDLLDKYPLSKHVHYMVAWDLGNKIASQQIANVMSTTQKEIYMFNTQLLAKRLMPDAIINCVSLTSTDIIMLMIMHDSDFIGKIEADNNKSTYNKTDVSHLFKEQIVKNNMFRIIDGVLESVIDVKSNLNLVIEKIQLLSNSSVVGEYQFYNTNHDDTINSFTVPIIENKQYRLQAPLKNAKELQLKVILKNGIVIYPDWTFPNSTSSMLTSDNPNAATIQNNKAIYLDINNNKVVIENDDSLVKNREKEYLTFLEEHNPIFVDAYHDYQVKLLNKAKQIWLVSDRNICAGDNGQAMFEYLNKEKKDIIDCYFIIEKESEDYEKMKKIGNVIARDTVEYYSILMLADFYLSSQIVDFHDNLQSYLKPLMPMLNYKRIFLQHGTIGNNIKKYINSFKVHFDGFIVAAPSEITNIDTFNLGYDDATLFKTGLARHDKLTQDNKEKIICIMPTCRKQLLGKKRVDYTLEIRRDMFFQSEFFIQYTQLLNNERLVNFAKDNGYKIWFVPHPDLFNSIPLFSINSEIDVKCLNVNYSELIQKCSCIVTDISSLQFDVAYTNKSIFYFQPDYYSLYNEETAHKKSVFSYELDGFGPVSYTVDTLVEHLCAGIETDFENDENQKDKAKDFFFYHDTKNRERIYNEIVKK